LVCAFGAFSLGERARERAHAKQRQKDASQDDKQTD
jgi:hypothetical protein